MSLDVATAVPLSFLLDPTSSQTSVEWYRLGSPRFTVYADRRAEKIARYGLGALEEAYRPFSILLGVHLENEPPLRPIAQENLQSRFARIPVIIGTAVDGGGFANPVTQNIELKIAGGSQKALFQHELTHRMMYEHLDLSIGPGGRVFTLAMTPTWWIEGLPEMLTQSVGRLQTAGVGRSMALNNAFPDWDRLHALYQLDSFDDYLRGYVTSGLFFRYLASDVRVGDLFELHRDLLWKTLTPPFITAADFFFYSKFGVLGSTYYKSFQDELKKYWAKKLTGLIPLSEMSDGSILFQSESSPRIDELQSGFLLSNLSAGIFPGSLEYRPKGKASGGDAAKRAAARRIPSELPGSALTEYRQRQNAPSFIWSLIPKRNSEGRRRYELVRGRIDGPIDQLESLDDRSSQIWDLESLLGESLVSDFLILDESRIFLLTNTFGTAHLQVFDSRAGVTRILASFDVPDEVSFVAPIPGRDLSCVSVIVDGDEERTSLQEYCVSADNRLERRREILPPGRLTLLSAAQHHDKGYLVLGGWGELVGLFRISDAGEISPIMPLKEWVQGLQPSYEPGQYYIWQHMGSGYVMRQLNLAKVTQAAAAIGLNAEVNSEWKTWPAWEVFVPPFVHYAQRVSQGKRAVVREEQFPNADSEMAGVSQQDRSPQGADVENPSWPAPQEGPADDSGPQGSEFNSLQGSSNGDESASLQNNPAQRDSGLDVTLPWESAPYLHQHWFTYPQFRPSFFGGPSLGIVSVPFRDEMERYQVTVIGDYSIDTNRASFTTSFASRRLFEEMRLDLFSRERFNGLYYRFPCAIDGVRFQCVSSSPGRGASTFFHYLRENGAKVSTTLSFKPRSTRVGLGLAIADVSPSIGVRFPELGPQFLTLATFEASLFLKLLEKGFYAGRSSRPGASMILLQSALEIGGDENVSVGSVRDGSGESIPTQSVVHFQNANLSLVSSLSYRAHRLTLRGEIGHTFGDDDLNRRQVFSPYRTYLLGSGSELNRLNVPIAGSRELFGYLAGDSMYRMTLDYAQPLLSDLNTRLTVVFLESIDFEAVLGRGGVAFGEDFSDPVAIDSFSSALRFNMDIKGFKIFPALAFGKLIDSDSWSIFAEVSFSDFF